MDERPPASDAATAARLVDALAAAGYETYACSLDAPKVREREVHVVRVIVTGLVPFWIGADAQRLGCHRLIGSSAPGSCPTFFPTCSAEPR